MQYVHWRMWNVYGTLWIRFHGNGNLLRASHFVGPGATFYWYMSADRCHFSAMPLRMPTQYGEQHHDEANIDFASRSFWHIYGQQILRRTHEIPFLVPNPIFNSCENNFQCNFIICINQSNHRHSELKNLNSQRQLNWKWKLFNRNKH